MKGARFKVGIGTMLVYRQHFKAPRNETLFPMCLSNTLKHLNFLHIKIDLYLLCCSYFQILCEWNRHASDAKFFPDVEIARHSL